MSNSDNNLKLITLYREAVHEPDDVSCDHRRLTLTMDYFDALEVESFSLSDENIRKFFGQDTGEELSEFDVAMHSIPLYSPDNDYIRSIEDKDPQYGDPFENEEAASYLCLIQVYITPEVLRRLDIYKDKEIKDLKDAADVYDSFFRDLHDAMMGYTKSCEDRTLCYRIYQSLSIGDFLIGIRCRRLDCVFRIMEMVRRRKFVNINKTDAAEPVKEPNSLILYKTYTIVSINDRVIPEEEDSAKTLVSGNRFILRAVLSNHYWSHEKEINAEYPPDVFLHSTEFKRLHGRYNFSVELSEEGFWYLLPTIKKYKLNDKNMSEDENCAGEHRKKPDEREKKICDFLTYLLSKGYISQLNERYVAGNESWKDAGVDQEVEQFCVLRTEEGYFNKAIRKEIDSLKRRIDEDYKRVKGLNTSRSTITYNMGLLKRLTNTCGAINGYSDSRIYAVVIIRLIEAALNGLEEFLDYYDKTYDHEVIKSMDSELNSAVADLNEFSKYILDNSLQSLQAPDYNLESHTSMEKLMTSYSAFLQRVIDWYDNTEFAGRIGRLQEKYVTVMVPKETDNGLSTKAYFYRRDEAASKENEKEKLLVVYCPSFYVLTDFAGSLGRLLHELAHYLRYEERAKRNELIVNYSAGLLFNQLGMDMVERFRTEVETLRDPIKIQELLDKCFTDNFIKYIKDNVPGWSEMKLMNLMDAISQCYLDLVDAVLYLGKLKRHIETFVRSSDNVILDDCEIERLWEFYERFFNEEKDISACIEKQVKERKELVALLGSHLFESSHAISGSSFRTAACGLYDILYSGRPDDKTEEDFYEICVGAAGFIRELTRSVTQKVNEFQDSADGGKIARYLAMGDYFVADNVSIDFMEFAQTSLLRTRVDSLEFWNENLYVYREVASDLFMAKVLGLTPFGYLNFCTRYLPADGMLNRLFVSRIALTVYAMSGFEDNVEGTKLYARWQEVFHALCGYIEQVIRSLLKEAGDGHKVEKDLTDFAERMKYYASQPVKNGVKMLDLVDEWGEFLQWFLEQTKELPSSHELVHCGFLCRNFVQIASYYGTEVLELQWSEELAEDLAGGGKALEQLHAELENSSLREYCRLIRNAFNEPKAVNEENGGTFTPKDMTEFVLNMHYDMIASNIEKFNDRHKVQSVLQFC